jgi:hypothetical protein
MTCTSNYHQRARYCRSTERAGHTDPSRWRVAPNVCRSAAISAASRGGRWVFENCAEVSRFAKPCGDAGGYLLGVFFERLIVCRSRDPLNCDCIRTGRLGSLIIVGLLWICPAASAPERYLADEFTLSTQSRFCLSAPVLGRHFLPVSTLRRDPISKFEITLVVKSRHAAMTLPLLKL